MKTLHQIASKITEGNVTGLSPRVSFDTYAHLPMDVLQIVEDPDVDEGVIGVFHLSQNKGPVPNDSKNWLYIATTTLDNLSQWTIANSGNHPVTKTGSMGYIYQDPDTAKVYLAYEHEDSGGNTITLKNYENMSSLKSDTFSASTASFSHSLPGSITISNSTQTTNNMGTPTIEAVDSSAVYLTFHYQLTAGAEDLPGRGVVLIKDEDPAGPDKDFTGWYAYDQDQITDSFRGWGVYGKIGGRDWIMLENRKIYFYEAQLSNADSSTDEGNTERWRSWRVFLYSPGFEMNQIELLNLRVMGASTFANPRTTIIGKKLITTVFVPSEADGALQDSTFLFKAALP